MSKLIIEGGKRLEGKVKVGGSKNAVLPIMAATLLTKEKCVLENVPRIGDVFSMIKIMESLGSEIKFEGNRLEIQTKEIRPENIPEKSIKKMRASVLLLAPFLKMTGKGRLPFPGGCVLGKRSLSTHVKIFEDMGAEVIEDQEALSMKLDGGFKSGNFVMEEMSVTASENAVMAAVMAPGKSRISLMAAEPHVADVCEFLNAMGAKISGIGTHTVEIEGVEELHGCEYKVIGDYLQAGTYALAGVLTGGQVTIQDFDPAELETFWQKLDEVGVAIERGEDWVTVTAPENFKALRMLKTAVHPGFPTDLQAPFAVLLTQAEGESVLFETLFEGRLNYLFELEKMGAKIDVLNPHQAVIHGPSKLKGLPISSCDIRAGAAMVLAALIAEGETEISNIVYIDRGYEDLEEVLRGLGGEIRRVEE